MKAISSSSSSISSNLHLNFRYLGLKHHSKCCCMLLSGDMQCYQIVSGLSTCFDGRRGGHLRLRLGSRPSGTSSQH